jgi:hypothetical protein
MDVASYCIRLDRRQLAEGTYHNLEVAKRDQWTGTNLYTSDIGHTPYFHFNNPIPHAIMLISNTSINVSPIANSHPPQVDLHNNLLEAHLRTDPQHYPIQATS